MDTIAFPDQKSLRQIYEDLLPERTLIVRELEICIEEALESMASRPRIVGRVKTFKSYFRKCIRLINGNTNGNPDSIISGQNVPVIGDLIGVRIICPFLEDLKVVEELLKEKFKVIEIERKGGNHTFREFGYESIHLLITVPENIIKKSRVPSGETAEIQVRTILQDAWAEVEHELVYKAEFTPFDNPLKRKLAAVNASLSLADIIFQEVRSYQRELNGELGKRRDSFIKKIEDSTDAILLSPEGLLQEEKNDGEIPFVSEVPYNASIDELLLNALYAHNKNQFDKAITFYSRILEANPEKNVCSLIYKHRGMAYFARSHYVEAIADFSESFKLDPKSYKSAYYEGIACSVLERYSDAIEAFNKSLEVNPYQPYCLFRRGQAYFHLADYPQALGDCESALTLESFEAARKFRDLALSKLKM